LLIAFDNSQTKEKLSNRAGGGGFTVAAYSKHAVPNQETLFFQTLIRHTCAIVLLLLHKQAM
jgi:hypothetical protein